MNKNIFVLAEQRETKLQPITLELLSESKRLAKKLGGKVICILFGEGEDNVFSTLGHYGADSVLVVEGEDFQHYSIKMYVSVLHELTVSYKPSIFLMGSTPAGREVAPALAAKIGTGLVTDCNILDIAENDRLVMTKFIFGGQASANLIIPNTTPQMATVRPGVIDAEEPDLSKKAEIIKVSIDVRKDQVKSDTRVVGFIQGDPKSIDLSDAEIIVAGGRGMDDRAHFSLITDLAEAINGSVGGSRVAVDKGWISYERQVGLSGKITKPYLFIACAISGAIQFQAGMRESKHILAINKDRYAPIFKIADLKILGDVHQLLPAFIDKIKSNKSKNN
jgi:electron transfer flavoprotein alpha subunit